MKCNQLRSGFEPVSLYPFPTTITITPRTPLCFYCNLLTFFITSDPCLHCNFHNVSADVSLFRYFHSNLGAHMELRTEPFKLSTRIDCNRVQVLTNSKHALLFLLFCFCFFFCFFGGKLSVMVIELANNKKRHVNQTPISFVSCFLLNNSEWCFGELLT